MFYYNMVGAGFNGEKAGVRDRGLGKRDGPWRCQEATGQDLAGEGVLSVQRVLKVSEYGVLFGEEVGGVEVGGSVRPGRRATGEIGQTVVIGTEISGSEAK